MLRFLERLLGRKGKSIPEPKVFAIHGGNPTYLLFMGPRRDRLMGRYRTGEDLPKEGDVVEFKDSEGSIYYPVTVLDVMRGPGYQGLEGFVQFHISVGDPI